MKNNTKKTEIIRAYASMVEKVGVEGASLSAVAKHMGINQSLIFHYFENKEDLMNQMAQHVANLAVKSYEKAWPADNVISRETFEHYVGYVLEIHYNRRRTVNPKLYYSLTYLIPRQDTVRETFVWLTDTLVVNISARLEKFREAGLITVPNPEMAARTLLCLADGILCYTDLTPKEQLKEFVETQKRLYFSYVNYQAADDIK